VLLWHVGKQVRNNLPRIAVRPEVLVGFDDVDHSGMSLSREGTAASNKELKLTKPGTIGASQLNSSVGRTSPVSHA
jgi:hypothetical protein